MISDEAAKIADYARIRELTGVDIGLAKRLRDELSYRVSSSYLLQDGSIQKSEHLEFGFGARGVLCEIFTLGDASGRDRTFVLSGEFRTPKCGELYLENGSVKMAWCGCGLNSVCGGFNHGVGLNRILREVEIGDAAGPASATPEARQDPAPRLAARATNRANDSCAGMIGGHEVVHAGNVFIGLPVLGKSDGKSCPASGALLRPLKNPLYETEILPPPLERAETVVLAAWTDGDCEAYIAECQRHCPDECASAVRSSSPKEKDVPVRRKAVLFYLAIGLDPKGFAAKKFDDSIRNLDKQTKIGANRYQKTFNIEAWIRGVS